MSQADELLNTLSDETGVPETTVVAEEHIIIGKDRIIRVPQSLRRIAVQFDHNIETVTFDCPRYWDDHDMSKMIVYINYLAPGGEPTPYLADNVTVDENDDSIMHFQWTISRNVTQNKGNLAILVCIKKTDDDGNEENHWNSELNKEFYVSEGMECDTQGIIDQYPDLVTQLLLMIGNGETIESINEIIKREIEAYINEHGISGGGITEEDKAELIASIMDSLGSTIETEVNEYFVENPVEDGYIPVKGVDYYTEEERAELVEDILADLSGPVSITLTRDGSNIIVDTILANSCETVSVITLNENDYPISVTTDGVECTINWDGFANGQED